MEITEEERIGYAEVSKRDYTFQAKRFLNTFWHRLFKDAPDEREKALLEALAEYVGECGAERGVGAVVPHAEALLRESLERLSSFIETFRREDEPNDVWAKISKGGLKPRQIPRRRSLDSIGVGRTVPRGQEPDEPRVHLRQGPGRGHRGGGPGAALPGLLADPRGRAAAGPRLGARAGHQPRDRAAPRGRDRSRPASPLVARLARRR